MLRKIANDFMRYVSQFELNEQEVHQIKMHRDTIITVNQLAAARDVSVLIKDNIGFKESEDSHNPFLKRFTMEFEAFDYDDWLDFKSRLFGMVTHPALLRDMLHELESKSALKSPSA